MTAAMVLPIAVARVKAPTGLPLTKEKSTAPAATPGQNLLPNRRMAATAMPADGAIKVTSPDMKEPAWPSIPPRK